MSYLTCNNHGHSLLISFDFDSWTESTENSLTYKPTSYGTKTPYACPGQGNYR